MGTLTPHFVARDPAVAAAWYGEVLGATEERRITLPGGQVLSVTCGSETAGWRSVMSFRTWGSCPR